MKPENEKNSVGGGDAEHATEVEEADAMEAGGRAELPEEVHLRLFHSNLNYHKKMTVDLR
jgi:hypothetical protein